MTSSTDAPFAVPTTPVLRSPKGPAVCSVQRPDADTFVLGPPRPIAWPSRAGTSLAGWVLMWAVLGFVMAAGVAQLLFLLGLALFLPVSWAWSALGDGAWGEVACALLLEGANIALLVLAVLALASQGRWVTFDRRRGLLTINRRPFGWRRRPRVVESWPLHEIVGIQLIRGGVAWESDPPDIYGGNYPVTGRNYDWYEFNLVLRGPDTPRLNLASGRDWMWIEQAGREVAEFLGVPLVDHL
jgi:hypothetical protein